MSKTLSVPFVRNPYNYDYSEVSRDTSLVCSDPTLAVQDARDECDINTIVRRFGLTGQLPDDLRMPQYGDFDVVADYQSALNAVMAADADFLRLPAEVRARFHNDPQELLEFCGNDKNRDEARKLGLLVPEPVKDPVLDRLDSLVEASRASVKPS